MHFFKVDGLKIIHQNKSQGLQGGAEDVNEVGGDHTNPTEMAICANLANIEEKNYPARRACALRALGLLMSDGALTVGRGKTF